jgi:DNA sulfur modification protein DndE
LDVDDLKTDGNGLELNRQTIFGDTELLYRCLICMNEQKEVSDNEFFPSLVKAHLDRGAKFLGVEARYNRIFYVNLCKLDSNL